MIIQDANNPLRFVIMGEPLNEDQLVGGYAGLMSRNQVPDDHGEIILPRKGRLDPQTAYIAGVYVFDNMADAIAFKLRYIT